jgi:TonB family protein
MQNTLNDVVADEEKTVNLKRTTIVTVFLVSFAVLAGTSFVALYAAYKAMSAASNVDDQWQSQHDRILRIEASSIQASADAALVKTELVRVDTALNEANKRMTEIAQVARQVTTYQAARDAIDAEKAAGQKKVADVQAEAALQIEAAEKKGAENFDKLVAYRLRSVWHRPESTVAGSKADVVVRFSKDGTITNASVASSSGVPDVDQSLLKAAADLAKIPELSTVSPVIYAKYLQERKITFDM